MVGPFRRRTKRTDVDTDALVDFDQKRKEEEEVGTDTWNDSVGHHSSEGGQTIFSFGDEDVVDGGISDVTGSTDAFNHHLYQQEKINPIRYLMTGLERYCIDANLEVFLDGVQRNVSLSPPVALVSGADKSRLQFRHLLALRFDVHVQLPCSPAQQQ